MAWISWRYVDDNKTRFIDVLREAVAIKSVSAWPDVRGEITKQVNWTKEKLEALGAKCELHDIGLQVHLIKLILNISSYTVFLTWPMILVISNNVKCIICQIPKKIHRMKILYFWHGVSIQFGKCFGFQTLPDGKKIPLPPVLLGQLGTDPKKKTVCVYGHLDVQPALKVLFE